MIAKCEDCSRPYGDEHGFPDLIVPNDVWRRISTHGDEGGLLCPSCICARIHKAGIRRVTAAFFSGPIDSTDYATMYALRRIENVEERLEREGKLMTPSAVEQAREILAQMFANHLPSDGPDFPPVDGDYAWAEKAMAALAAAGLKVLPREPTESMCTT